MSNLIKCKKIAYSTEEFALYDLLKIKATVSKNKKPIRAYKCNICNNWHLTSSLFKTPKSTKTKSENRILKIEELTLALINTKLKCKHKQTKILERHKIKVKELETKIESLTKTIKQEQ